MPIITCCNKDFSIPYVDDTEDSENTGSEFIKDLVKQFNDVNIVIPITDKYCNVIDNYVEFTNGNEVPITSRERLLLCFQLNTLLIDDAYFRFCVRQTFNNWSYMCNMVYNIFNDNL